MGQKATAKEPAGRRRYGMAAVHVANFEGGCRCSRPFCFLVAQAFLPVPACKDSWIIDTWLGCDCVPSVGARPREPMRDLRHAVRGERTWRGRAIYRGFEFESNNETFEAPGASDGARVLVARSGTACRAPTVGEKQGRKERERVSAEDWRHALRFYLRHRQECLCY